MSADEKPNFPWEPLTPRGVAMFAHARLANLLLVQFVVALLAATSVVWFLDDSVCPVVRDAIKNLPDSGQIRSAKLDWRGDASVLLAEGRFIAFDVDLDHDDKINSTADVQVEFGQDTVWCELNLDVGYMEIPYPDTGPLPFNRKELEPLWGAWKAEVLFVVAVLTAGGLLASWWILATIYFLPIWILSFFVNRDLNFRQSWRLSGAALLPGALLMATGIVLYDFGAVNLVQFGFIFGAHFILGWIYLFVSLLFVPAIPTSTPKGNPFADKKSE